MEATHPTSEIIHDNRIFDMLEQQLDYSDHKRVQLVILNRPVIGSVLLHLFKQSLAVCCADGGANRLYDLFGESGETERT